MYLDAGDMHYRLANMSVDAPMIIGMVLIVLGLAATAFGLVCKPAGIGPEHVGGLRVRAMDEARIGPAHVGLLLVLAVAITIGFPLNFAVAALYGFWSSRKTIFLLAAITAAALFGFGLAGNEVAHDRTLLYSLLVVPIWGISSVLAVLAAYSAEVYPTRVRSRGTGLAAGSSKAAGVLATAEQFGAVPAG